MTNRQKNIENNLRNKLFAVLLSVRTSHTIWLQKTYIISCSNSFGRSLVALLPRVVVAGSQNLRGCALSVYTSVNKFLSLLCEPATKICTRRQVRRKQTSSRRNGLLSSALQRRRSSNFSEVTSIGHSLPRGCTVVQHRSWVSGARMLSAEKRHRSRNSRKNSKRWRIFTGIGNAESFHTMRSLSIM